MGCRRRIIHKIIIFVSLLLALTGGQAGTHTIVRADGPLEIDGRLDEPYWETALAIPLAHEWSPGDGIAPPVETTALLLYDDSHLYVAFRAHDPQPSKIRAHLMDRDSIGTFVQDDHVSLMIDTFNDERRAYQFRVNPLGVQADAIFSEIEGIEDFSWDIIWDSAGRITDEGYVVELALPLNQIRFAPSDGDQTWGIELGRSYPRSVRHRIAANRRDRNRNCLLCQLIKVDGFRGLRPGQNLELAPTATYARTDRLDAFPDGSLEEFDEESELGLTARWSVTPNLTLNAAVKPDFSQVEADVAQLDVNNRFALFFPEKRPFFLEAIDFFATPINALFTRTIGDMDYGAKVTGKQGRSAYGVFLAHDANAPLLLLPANQFSRFADLGGSVDTGVARYRLDVLRNSTVGFLFAGRQGDDYENSVAGVDAFLRLGAKNTLSVQFLRSETEDPTSIGDDPGGGRAFEIDYDYADRNWLASVLVREFDEAFRADAGFVPRNDLRRVQGFAQRRWWGERDDWYNQINVGLVGLRSERLSDGRLTDEVFDLFANVSGPLQSFVELSLQRSREYLETAGRAQLYDDLERVQLFFTLQPLSRLKGSAFVERGDALDVFNNRRGDLLQLSPALEIKAGRHLNLQFDHTRQQLDVPGGRLFRADLSQARIVYQFNVRTFVRAILQWQRTQRDLGLYDVCVAAPGSCPFTDRQENLFTQLLFSYKFNPQTVAFVGYSDNQADRAFVPGSGFIDAGSLTRTDRTVFVKLGYAWIR